MNYIKYIKKYNLFLHMSIFQFSKKIMKNIKQYVYYPNTFFDINHMDNMSILHENINKCIVINHNIEKFNIKQIDIKTIEIHIKPACDIVFDFEISGQIPYKAELLCDGIIIFKNIDYIKYENAFPIASAGCNFIKIRLQYENNIDSKDIQVNCKYGLLPLESGNKLKKLDIHKICQNRIDSGDWIIC